MSGPVHAGRTFDVEGLVRSIRPEDPEWLLGFADLGGLLPSRYGGFPYAVVLGRRLDDKVVDGIRGGPTREYAELYRTANEDLSRWLARIAGALGAHGVRAAPVEPTVPEKTLDESFSGTLRTDFSHKMAGTRAGLGWIGKTDLFVSKRFGPRLRLATVLIDAPAGLAALPVDESGCGECALCVETCPAGAASGRAWSAGVDRDEFFDAFKCRDKCLELSLKGRLGRRMLCGICVSVCPAGAGGPKAGGRVGQPPGAGLPGDGR